MSTRSDVTSNFNAKIKERSGIAYFHCVDMIFGSTLRAVPASSPPVPDSEVSWVARGDISKLQILSSVDEGGSWQFCYEPGQPIRVSAGGDASGHGDFLPIGSRMTNRTILLRALFRDGAPGVVLESITVRVTLETGEVVSRTESGAALMEGKLIGVSYDAAVGGVRASSDTFLAFAGNRGALLGVYPAHDEPPWGGQNIGLHVSHGPFIDHAGQGVVANIETQGFPDDKASGGIYGPIRQLAAMAVECWVYPQKTHGTLWGWTTNQYGLMRGIVVYLEETTATVNGVLVTASRLRCDIADLRGRTLQDANDASLFSADNMVQLNEWVHVAFSYDGIWAHLMLNGVLVARKTLQVGLQRYDAGVPQHMVIGTDGDFVVGRDPLPAGNKDSTDPSFQGYLSELRVWDRRLTAGAVVQRMRRRVTDAAEIASLVAYNGLRAIYPLNHPTGFLASDLSGLGLDLSFDQQQPPGSAPPLQPQLGWHAEAATTWRGFPSVPLEFVNGLERYHYNYGRESPRFSLDGEGDVLRLTNAPHDITFPLTGELFRGVGDLGQLQLIQEPVDLVPTGAELSLSGIKPNFVSLAIRADYIDRPVTIYLVLFDADGALVGDPVRVFEGKMDTLNVVLGDTATLQMTAESHLRRWSTPGNQRWNHAAQLARFRDDWGLEFLAEMVDREVWWPARLKAT